MAAALLAGALALVPDVSRAAEPAPASASASALSTTAAGPASGSGPGSGSGSATLANGERLELIRGDAGEAAAPGFRVVPKTGHRSGRYAYATTGNKLSVQPVGEREPLPATTITTGAPRTSAPAPRAAAASYRVTIKLANADHIGPIIRVWNRSTWMSYDVAAEQYGSSGTIALPPGDYLTAGLYTSWQKPGHLLTKTFTVKDRGLTVTLDASLAKETALTADEPTARPYATAVWLSTPKGGMIGFAGGWGGATKVYVTPFTLPGVSLRIHSLLVKDGATANNPSPYRYDLFHGFDGAVPATPKVQVRTADLGRTVTTLRSAGQDTTGSLLSSPSVGDSSGAGISTPVRIPSTVTEYMTPGIAFTRMAFHDGGPRFDGVPRTLVKGANAGETFGGAAYAVQTHESAATLRGSRLSVYEPWGFGDAAGHRGSDSDAVQDFRLTSNGATVAEATNLSPRQSFSADLAQTQARYQLVHTVRHTGKPNRLTPRQTNEWAFTASGYGVDTRPRLTDVALRVDGLDIRNAAGTSPVTVHAHATSRTPYATAKVTGLEFSLDDGATWTALPFTAAEDRASAQLTVAQDTRFVSLRTTGEDDGGSTVRRTVIRAFAGPAPLTDENVGATRISDVAVNGRRVIAPATYDDPYAPPYTVRFTATDPSGIAATGAVLYRGAHDRPDAVIPVQVPQCTEVDATTSTCEAGFWLNARTQLGRNDLAGEWRLAVWAYAADGQGFTDLNTAGTALILRQTRVTIKAPTTPVTAGTLFTISGIAGINDWSTGRWNALAGKSVKLEYRKPGVSTYTTAATVTSDSTGTVKATVKAAHDANWRWLLPRTPGVGAAASPLAFVDVR
ncbi:hypothetical protein QWM81_13120 [Streptomyces ficellus]|uniref:DNRLRE domain-containing protein n=1 Tax=Streptomyces ficellus TaxID=1977088 RepID=A0ABT7Z6B7_9ACTN|nr:hypothetical protein [Streptomyces ficellus]MDN3294976.1 hypothetical protein [Streptomyces ficellus]